MAILKINHIYGFFSCCSVKLYEIVNYFNQYKILPYDVDSSGLFGLYKPNNDDDITFDFFENYKNKTQFDLSIAEDGSQMSLEYKPITNIDKYMFQYDNYRSVNYQNIVPFVKKYFEPSHKIKTISNNILTKYSICPDNCIGIYYRGTDKIKETYIDSFDSFYNKLNDLIHNINNEQIQIIIQTDTAQFLDYMKEKCINKNIIIIQENSVSYTNNGIHYEKTNAENYLDIQNLFATIIILAKCKYLLCSSGNVSIWTMFFRENAENIHQNLDYVWL